MQITNHINIPLGLKPYLLLLVLIFGLAQTIAQNLQGRIIDAQSKEGIPFGTILVLGTQKPVGTSSNVQGHFSLQIPQELLGKPQISLRISSVGYETKEYTWHSHSAHNLGTIALSELSNELETLVVRPKKERYRKKNNPAVMLIERAIAAKDSNQIKLFPDYSFQEYEKVLISQVGVSKGKKYFGLSAKTVDVYKDSSELVGLNTMPLSLREKQTVFASRGGTTLSPVITGRRIHGIEDTLDEGAITNGMEELLGGDIDVYANNIKMLHSEFPSPMNKHWATSFYKYYIKDTVDYQGSSCFLMHFRPMNSRDIGLMGKIWIDTTQLSLRRVEMEMPKVSGLNFVEKMSIDVHFDPKETPRGAFWLPSKKKLAMILKPSNLFKHGVEVLVEREQHHYRFGAEALRPEYLDPRSELPETERKLAMQDRAGNYGLVDRPSALSAKEQKAVDFRAYLRQHKGFKILSSIGRLFTTGYLPIPFDLEHKERVKFDFGPYETMLGYNALEGWKLRIGGMTTANLMQHLFFEGYASYGMGDKAWKYYAKATYTPRKCIYQVSEGPRNNLSLMATKEVFLPGDEGSSMFKDGLASLLGDYRSLTRYYGEKYQLQYERDWTHNLSTKIWAQYLRKTGAGDLKFFQYDQALQAHTIPHVEESQIGAEATWVFGRARLRTAREGKSSDVTRFRPVITAGLKFFPKSLGGNPTSYLHSSLGYKHRLLLSMWGRLDINLEAGAVWGNAPQTSLFNPNANSGWLLRDNTFQTLRPIEYVADKYLSFMGTYHMRGLIFNRIPLIKHLRLREVFSINGYWGDMSAHNQRPRVGMPYLPSNSMPMNNHLHLELGAGIENIFSILRLEYFYRLTAPHIPPAERHAIRIRTSISF